ncbi:gliding motility-associated C-terminal domain-containing protein, partial [Flavivirga jejuensis]
DASFNYSAAAYCADAIDPIPTITGLTGGTFSSTVGLSITAGTGLIDVSASTPGTYTVTYTTAGICSNTSTANVTINALPNIPVMTTNSPVCSGSDAVFTITGTPNDIVTYNGSSAGNVTIGALGTVTITINNITAAVTINLVDITNPNCNLSLSISETIVISSIDTDGDGVIDCDEATPLNGGTPTNSNDFCSYNPADVTQVPSIAWNNADCDGDGVTNGDELTPPDGESATDPHDPCSYRPSDITIAVTTTTDCTAELEVTKLADAPDIKLGDEIRYTIEVENTGNVTLTSINLVDTFTDINGSPLTLTEEPVFDDADLGSEEGTLLVGEIATYTATFEITQQAINSGGVRNSVEASGISPSFETITDTSDDGDDVDGNTLDDPTETALGCLIVLNEFSPNGDGVNDFLIINCIENYSNNRLEIYNRWGNIVYKKTGYNNEFDGTSNGRTTIQGTDKLPVGTYYYVLDLGEGSKPKVGWIYINR